MEYTIINAPYVKDLIPKVNKAIKEGWKPQGGLVSEGQERIVYQAMTREIAEDE
jgi:hypothetical protein